MPGAIRFVLDKPPLVYTVGVVRFSAFDLMANAIPALQDRMRKLGYPRPSEGQVSNVHITPLGTQTSSAHRWEFHNRNRSAGIILSKDFVAFQTAKYENFSVFCSSFESTIQVIRETIGTDLLIERIGLRYVDVIVDSEDGRISELICSGLLGLDDAKLGVTQSSMFANYSGKTEAGMLSIRAHQRSDGMFLPPDLGSVSVNVSAPGVLHGSKLMVLDFDHSMDFQADPPDFSAKFISDYFWRLHDNLTSAFLAATTPLAWKKWGKRDRTE